MRAEIGGSSSRLKKASKMLSGLGDTPPGRLIEMHPDELTLELTLRSRDAAIAVPAISLAIARGGLLHAGYRWLARPS